MPSPSRPVRVVLADDYPLVMHGVSKMLEKGSDRVQLSVVAMKGALPDFDSDIVLYDPADAARATALECEKTLTDYRARRLVIFTWDVDVAMRNETLGDVPSGYVSKRMSSEQLVTTLEAINAEHGLYGRAHPGNGAASSVRWPGQAEGLSRMESRVVALIVQGYSNDSVAGQLLLSVNTIKSYIRTAYSKMGVTTRTRAVLWGIDHQFARSTGASRTWDGHDSHTVLP